MSTSTTPHAWPEMAVWVPNEGFYDIDTELAQLDQRGVRMSGAVGAVALIAVLCALVMSLLAA
jgi:hypothetical protein